MGLCSALASPFVSRKSPRGQKAPGKAPVSPQMPWLGLLQAPLGQASLTRGVCCVRDKPPLMSPPSHFSLKIQSTEREVSETGLNPFLNALGAGADGICFHREGPPRARSPESLLLQ